MKNRKRILAAILTAIMTISILPANSFASEAGENDTAEAAVEAVSVSDEEQEVESTVEDISEETTEEKEEVSSETVEAEEEAGPAEEAEAVTEDVEMAVEEDAEADDAVDTEETFEDEIPEEEEAVPAETVEWPITLQAKSGTYNVTVTYGEDAGLPADAKVSVDEITASDRVYDDYVEQAADTISADVDDLAYAKLFDIKLIDADGNKLEPTGFVDVKIRLKDIGQVEESTQVVHFAGDAEVPEVLDTDVSGKDVSFETDGFSIYAVIGTGNFERLTVNFYGAKDATTGEYALIDTMYVKTADQADAGRIKQIVYDPGAGTIPDGYAFYGWSIGTADYSIAIDGSTVGASIEDVREAVQGYAIPEGDTGVLNIYAMLATHYTVRYIDDKEHTVGTDTAMVKQAGDPVDYTVSMAYSTDSEHKFEGWLAANGIENITEPSDATAATLFENGTTIKIIGNVEFSVKAPAGHWLVFDENGKHATYNAPQFVESNDVTKNNLLPMERNGYTFGGWYTGAPETEEGDPTGRVFEFGNELETNTTIYAKWIPNGEAEYTVIIWKEGLTPNTWDFYKTLKFTGNVGQSASSAVVPVGNPGNRDRYAKINGTNYNAATYPDDFTGFSYSTHDANVTITPEGDALVNVRYIRNTYTLTFRYGIANSRSTTMTERYGTYLGDRFPLDITFFDWGGITDWIDRNFGKWAPQNSKTFTNKLVYIDTMPAEDVTFHVYGVINASMKTMRYYVEALPNETGQTVTFDGKKFVLLNEYKGRYNFFTESEDFVEMNGYTKYKSDPEFVNNEVHNSNVLNCYYTRNLETINFMNGSYYDGNNRRMSTGSGQLGTAEGILYNSDISSYNKGGDNYFVPAQQEGYVFEGWYIDVSCTVPYTFNRMSSGGITVYAKWRQIEYRVFLRPNAGTKETEPTLYWGSDKQEMNFRVAYGDKISAPVGTRTGYKFLGWHSDPECTIPVYAQGLVMNEKTVTDIYDKTLPENMTDTMDRWGNGATINKDDEDHEDRWWITKRFELFGKWGRVIEGAEGIGVVYVVDVQDGSNAPKDTLLYQDNTTAVAGAAPKANAGKVFEKWVVQKWDGNGYVDDVEVLPGQTFDIHVENAKILPEGSNTPVSLSDVTEGTNYTYTIQVKAVFSDAEEVVPTHITWYKNDGSGESYRKDEHIKINEAVDIYGTKNGESVPARTGYNFLGWAKAVEQEEGSTDIHTSTDSTELFLTYRDGEYFTADNTKVTQVAADEVTPYEALYAIWEEKEFKIYHSATGKTESIGMSAFDGDITKKVTTDYLYGGYYKYVEDGDHKGDAIKICGLNMTPDEGATYYLKEVDARYLRPAVYLTWSTIHNGLIRNLYGFVDYDTEADYNGGGLDIGGELIPIWGKGNLTDGTITVTKQGEGREDDILTAKSLFNIDNAVFGYVDLTSKISGGARLRINGYYITQDGVKVTGYKTRVIQFAENDPDYGAPVWNGWNNNGNTICGLASVTPTYTPVSRSLTAGKFTLMRSLKINAPAEKIEYTITKVYDPGVDLQVVEEGDHSGEITYAEKSGYYFAGWYKDGAFTEPADFSDVKSDLTVYAKYVKASDISASFSRKSSKSGTTTFNAEVAVKGKSDLADVTVMVNGKNASVLGNASVKKTGSGKNVKYTTQYKGTAAVSGLSLIGSFTASVSWTTADGTAVAGPAYKCTYILGLVTVK